MTKKNTSVPVLILGMLLTLAVLPVLNAQEQPPQEETQPAVEVIPQQVKQVLLTGLATREARLDIPFNITKHLYLPARENMHSIFLMKARNADLGFVPPAPVVQDPAGEEAEAQSSFEVTPSLVKANSHVFLYFKQNDGAFEKEVYIPFNLQIDGASYDPEEDGLYCTGYPLPPGNYTLAMAVASQDLTRIGTQYFDFTLPNPAGQTEGLETTPIFFAKNIQRLQAPETTAEFHKGYFTYSVLQIEPNLESLFTAGDNLDIFFFIMGVQPNMETGRFDVIVNYEVKQNDELVIKYAESPYDSPIISQPLPMKKTVIVKTTKGEETSERREQRDLEPGIYTLTISIKDNVSGKTIDKAVDFTVVDKQS